MNESKTTKSVSSIYFIGIGGIGMSGLAEILRSLEFDVSGSDLKESDVTKRLAELGVRIDVGHRGNRNECVSQVLSVEGSKSERV